MSQRSIHHYLRPNHPHPNQVISGARQIEIILENIDLTKIHNVMIMLDWQWYHLKRTPNESELKKQAKSLLENVWNTEENAETVHYSAGTGGFTAHKWVYDGLRMLSLEFVLTEWELDYEDVQCDHYT